MVITRRFGFPAVLIVLALVAGAALALGGGGRVHAQGAVSTPVSAGISA